LVPVTIGLIVASGLVMAQASATVLGGNGGHRRRRRCHADDAL
jgi:hypothetical protein